MKRMKKLASLLLAAIMVLAMAVPAMAAEDPTPSVTASDLLSHKFYAYQIFKGEKDDDGRLGNIEWSDGINVTGFTAGLEKAGILTDDGKVDDVYTAYTVSKAINAAKEKANEIAKIADENIVADKKIELTVAINGTELKVTNPELNDGYYIIVDETPDNNGVKSIFNLSLLQVSGDGEISIRVKTDIPSVEKDVLDDNDAEDKTDVSSSADGANNGAGWGETADFDIGQIVPFRLTATIPSTVDMAQYDTYTVVFNDTMSAGLTFKKVKSLKLNGKEISLEHCDVSDNAEDGAKGKLVWTITIEDVKKLPDIILTENNVIEVEYDAVLNEEAVLGPTLGIEQNNNDVYLEYSNQPNGNGKGKTENDKVYVFTFTISGAKEDGNKKPLAGAQFALYKENKDVDGNVISRDYATLNGNKVTGWVNIAPGADGKYDLTDKGVGEVTSAEKTGQFAFEGLDAGDYMLQETVTPAGYNTAPDASAKITVSGHKETAEGATAELVLEPEVVTVVNNRGAQLPETGGIGTTIFYVLGTILVVGAVILLVTKKRMGVEK